MMDLTRTKQELPGGWTKYFLRGPYGVIVMVVRDGGLDLECHSNLPHFPEQDPDFECEYIRPKCYCDWIDRGKLDRPENDERAFEVMEAWYGWRITHAERGADG